MGRAVTGQTERERVKERKREGEREGERGREREGEKEGGRERMVIFIFKRDAGCLGTF